MLQRAEELDTHFREGPGGGASLRGNPSLSPRRADRQEVDLNRGKDRVDAEPVKQTFYIRRRRLVGGEAAAACC